jgi:hypothetical protein
MGFALLPFILAFFFGLFLLSSFIFFLIRKKSVLFKFVVILGFNLSVIGALLFYTFSDVPALVKEFDRLCDEEAGAEVYFQIPGSLNDYRDDSGKIRWSWVDRVVSVSFDISDVIPKRIEKRVIEFYYKKQVIAKRITFTYWGGSFSSRMWVSTGNSCKYDLSTEEFYTQIFRGN